uniref:Tudor domain containing 1 n=1 Tax=Hypotaenidia okinawae TaxID=2861861 RepID=A0A6G1RT37_9GRUI
MTTTFPIFIFQHLVFLRCSFNLATLTGQCFMNSKWNCEVKTCSCLKPKKMFCNSCLSCVCAGGKLVTCTFLLFQLETSLEHWKSMELATGESLTVCGTEIVSPDLFCAIPVVTKDQEKLHRQLIELENYWPSWKSQPSNPKLGEACWARFSGKEVEKAIVRRTRSLHPVNHRRPRPTIFWKDLGKPEGRSANQQTRPE